MTLKFRNHTVYKLADLVKYFTYKTISLNKCTCHTTQHVGATHSCTLKIIVSIYKICLKKKNVLQSQTRKTTNNGNISNEVKANCRPLRSWNT